MGSKEEEAYEQLFEGVTKRTIFVGKGIYIAEIRFKALSRSRVHQHPDEHIGYVIAGELIYHSDGFSRNLRSGDVFLTPMMQLHSIEALENSLVLEACSSNSWRVIEKSSEWCSRR